MNRLLSRTDRPNLDVVPIRKSTSRVICRFPKSLSSSTRASPAQLSSSLLESNSVTSSSTVPHSARARKKCMGKHEPIGECFSLLLECSSRSLCALQQNRAQSRLLYLFHGKEQVIFFKNSTLFPRRPLLKAN